MAKKKSAKTGEKQNKSKEEEKAVTLKEAILSIEAKKRVVLVFFAAFFVVSMALLFVYMFINVVTPEKLTEEEFLVLLPKLDGREWKMKKGDDEKLSSLLYSFEPESALTKTDGSTLMIILSDGTMSYTLRFAWIGDAVSGVIGSKLFTLYHSAGKRETDRVLSLISKEEKITLYEE